MTGICIAMGILTFVCAFIQDDDPEPEPQD